MFGGIGITELGVIFAVALIVFGPQRLPEMARSMGRALGEFRRASNDLRQSLREAEDAGSDGKPDAAKRDAPAAAATAPSTPGSEAPPSPPPPEGEEKAREVRGEGEDGEAAAKDPEPETPRG